MSVLLLLRHAEAGPPAGGDDFGRPLTARGRADATRLGAWLRDCGLAPDAAFVSPSRRTRETAERALAALANPPAPRFDEAFYNADAAELRREISTAKAATLLVVAHNPGVAELARTLVAEGEARVELPNGYPPCALAVFESIDRGAAPFDGRFRLIESVTPETIR